jgi:hypothetical protein
MSMCVSTEGDIEKNLKIDHLVNEENMDTHEMNSSSPMDNLKSIPIDLNFFAIKTFPHITDIEQEFFLTVNEPFIKTSCSKNYFHLLPYSNCEYALEYISNPHVLQEQDNHTDIFTSGKEINMQDIHLLSQQSTFNLEEENHLQEECVDCKTTPSVEPTMILYQSLMFLKMRSS